MSRPRVGRLLATSLALAVPAVAAPQSASPDPGPAASPVSSQAPAAAPAARGERRFRVRYRSATSVYLEGGRAQGLEAGDRLRVVERGRVVAEIEVAYVADQSASCRVLSETRPVREGDEAVAPPRRAEGVTAGSAPSPPTVAPTVAATAPAAAPSARPGGRPWARARGTASFGYFLSRDDSESNYDFDQRTARLAVGLSDLGGRPLSFTLRARSRQDVRSRTLSARTPARERNDRLYEAALRYEPPEGRLTLEFGRIGVHRFAGSGFLDGGLARWRLQPSLEIGAFAGRATDFESLRLGGGGRQLGGFLRLAPGGRYASGGYDATLAAIREDADGDLSREYLSLETRLARGDLTLFQRAELDWNRGWRQQAAGSSAQLSNLSLSANLRLAPASWAFVSYDGRRNYRYYQNRLVPEEVFDDLLHQGLRAGLSLARAGGFGATLGAGLSLREKDPRFPELSLANAWSGNVGLRHANAFGSGHSVGIDGTGFSNGYTEGALVSARLGRRLGAGSLLDLSYGRSFYRIKATAEDRTTEWLRFLARLDLPHRLYVLGDVEYDRGDDLRGPRGLIEIGVRF